MSARPSDLARPFPIPARPLVPSERDVSPSAPRRPRLSEAELVRSTARYLETLGYRVRIDPDGADYFDLVARRGREVGLVEA